MIRKQTVFIDYNVKNVGGGLRRQGRRLESDLAELASDISMNEGGFNPPHLVMQEIFKVREVRGFTLTWEISSAFTIAAVNAHRTESVLLAELSGSESRQYYSLKLSMRFYHKEERDPFFEWNMKFNNNFVLLQSGVIGRGELGERVTAKC